MQFSGLETILSDYTSLKNIQQVTMNCCGLDKFPDIESLEDIQFLDISENKLTSLDVDIKNGSLKELNVTKNPIVSISSNMNNFPSLVKLHVGSPEMKYLAPTLLQRISTNFNVFTDNSCKDSLVYPQHKTLKNNSELKAFLEKRSLKLDNVKDSEKVDCFGWLMDLNSMQFKSLSLSNQERFLQNERVDLCVCLKKNTLQAITELYLDNCGLHSIPDLSSNLYLETIDIKYNNIESLEQNFLPVTVKNIFLEGNPIPCVHIDHNVAPELSSVGCGSEMTQYISSSIIERMTRSVVVTVAKQYKQYLVLPPLVVLEQREHLLAYVDHPEKYLAHIRREIRPEALDWLVKKNKSELTDLDFTSQKWLFPIGKDSFLNGFNLTTVQSLVLSNCGLQKIPNLKSLVDLKSLGLHDNALYCLYMEEPFPTVETLNITRNPLNEIDFNTKMLPNLKHLVLGSDQTNFIANRVLTLVAKGILNIDIPREFRAKLFLPRWKDISSGTDAVRDYIENKTLCMSHITDFEKRWKAISWQLTKAEKNFTQLDFSSQKEFCHHIKVDRFSDLLWHQCLRGIQRLDLSDCELESLPAWEVMTNLTDVNVSGNQLQAIPQSMTIKQIDLTRNKIVRLYLPKNDFPNLKAVTVGSETLQFIGFELLKRVSVNILYDYRNSLVMPPWYVFDQNKTDDFVENPETYLTYVNKSKLEMAIDWLANDADFEFLTLNLSRQEKTLSGLSETQLSTLLNGKNVKKIETLNMNHWGLSHLPNLASMKQLKYLLFAYNKLKDLSKLKHELLEVIDITMNHVERVDIDFHQCPNLKTLVLGSGNTRYLSTSVLEKLTSSDFIIKCEPLGKNQMLLPPPHINMNNPDRRQISDYLNSGLFDLTWYLPERNSNPDNFGNVMHDIVQLDTRKITELQICNDELSGLNLDELLNCSNLLLTEKLTVTNCNIIRTPSFQHLCKLTHVDFSGNPLGNKIEKLQEAINTSNAASWSYFNLSNTNLKYIPDIGNLDHLISLDISYNAITTLEEVKNSSLKMLNVSGNMFSVLNFMPVKIPNLVKVAFGSAPCKFVSIPILKKSESGKLELKILDNCRNLLLVPSANMLNDRVQLSTFLTSAEIKLNQFGTDEPEKQCEALMWLTENKDFACKCLNLEGHKEFCLNVGIETLNHIIFKINTITTLLLAQCNLLQIPDISSLSQLLTLDLRDNYITELNLANNKTLQEIDLQGNPILSYHLSDDSLPALKLLKLGSNSTKYISLGIMSRVHKTVLEVKIEKMYEEYLIYPPARVLGRKIEFDKFFADASLTLSSIPADEREEALSWVIKHSGTHLKSLRFSNIEHDCVGILLDTFTKHVNHLKQLRHLYLDGLDVTMLPDISSLENLCLVDLRENNINNLEFMNCLPTSMQELDLSKNPLVYFESSILLIRKLKLRGCLLKCFPPVQNLSQLENLDIGDNKISYITDDLYSPNLKQIMLDGNPLEEITFTNQQLPALIHLTCGSEHLKFLGLEMLQILLNQSTNTKHSMGLIILDKFVNSLILPPPKVILPGGKLILNYIKSPYSFLNYISDIETRAEALEWMLKHTHSFKRFSLTGQDDLVRRLTFPGLQKVLTYDSMQNISSLDLSGCGLTLCPNIKNLNRLTDLNLNNNKIISIDEIERCELLEHLYLMGNPISEIRSDTNLFDRLKVLHVGSHESKFISHNVLKRVLTEELNLVVAEAHKSALLCPTANILYNRKKLESYISTPESILEDISEEQKVNVFNWIINKSQHVFDQLSLSNRSELFWKERSKVTLQLLDSERLSKIHTLILNSCSLKSVPRLNKLPLIEELDLSDNLLQGFSIPLHLPKLKRLSLIGNCMDRVEFDICFLPNLETLSCGSDRTKCISLPILRRVVTNDTVHQLSIKVPEQFQKYLILPSYKVLKDKEALTKFVNNPEKEIDSMPPEEKENTFLWLLDQRGSSDSLNLSGQVDICSDIDKLNSLLGQQKLCNIEALHLDNCRLTELPQLAHFSRLKEIHVQFNSLTEIVSEKLPCCLESIFIAGNAIETVQFDLTLLKFLRFVNCGSHHTKFISFNVTQSLLD